jgi:hypothetical protein
LFLLLLLLSARAKFFSTKHQVLKNSSVGQKSIDFDLVSVKMLEKLKIAPHPSFSRARTKNV